MKGVIAKAKILNTQNQPAPGVSVRMESFNISSRSWQTLATGQSDANGNIALRWSDTQDLSNDVLAPNLRLVEVKRSPVVLADGGTISYDARSQILSIDFGEVSQVGVTMVRRDVSALRASDVQMRRDLETNNATIRANTAAIQAKDRELVQVRKDLQLRETELQTAKRQTETTNQALSNTSKELNSTRATLDATRIELNSTKVQIEDLRSQLTELKANPTTASSAELISARSELSAVKATLASLNDEETRKQPIQTIAQSIGEQVDLANSSLQQNSRSYTLGKIELDLRGTVTADGKMALANATDTSERPDRVYSGIKLEILPFIPRKPNPHALLVPDLGGLTESAVRRILVSLGLKLDLASKSVKAESGIAIGQSIGQSPKAGTEIQRGASVIVVFASLEPTLSDPQ